ncbi:Uncharacterized protein FWK35_00007651 [Aphis craccivora]|uniref:Uncharacterized protein n=1 Tax=Aphis craccivora TaxID=307492 RepID=A0A6G0ZH20_APHCR|nr:Uncharacterized protein FWK35_00007651 [Aphis craccivora]
MKRIIHKLLSHYRYNNNLSSHAAVPVVRQFAARRTGSTAAAARRGVMKTHKHVVPTATVGRTLLKVQLSGAWCPPRPYPTAVPCQHVFLSSRSRRGGRYYTAGKGGHRHSKTDFHRKVLCSATISWKNKSVKFYMYICEPRHFQPASPVPRGFVRAAPLRQVLFNNIMSLYKIISFHLCIFIYY